MNVLIACEESQRVCTAFREKGHRAFSCDILDCSGGHPEWHIKGDVLPLLNGHCEFTLQNGQTDRQMGFDYRTPALYRFVRQRRKVVCRKTERFPTAESSCVLYAFRSCELRPHLYREPGRHHEQCLQKAESDHTALVVW